MTPTLTASYLVVSSAANTTPLVTPSFTPAVGEIIVVKVAAENGTGLGTPSGGSLTYTSRASFANVNNNAPGGIWTTTTTSASSMTVSSGTMPLNYWHSMVVERWSNAQLAATPATNTTKNGAGAPSTTLTTVASNSVVSFLDADYSAVAPGSYAYRSSATDEGIHDKSTAIYVAYYAWQTAASTGSQTFGLTSPTGQTWTLLGIEIQDAGSAPALPPELIMQTRRPY